MDLEQLLTSLRSPGGLDSSGRFLLDFQRARELMSQLRLPDPHAYVLHLVAAAVAFGAEAIEVRCGRGQVCVGWEGDPLELGQLEELVGGWGVVDQRSRALGELSLGLAGALALRPRRLEIASGGNRLVLTPPGATLPTRDDRRTEVLLQRSPWRWLVPPEGQLVASRCRFSPVPLRLNGRELNERRQSRKPALTRWSSPLPAPVDWQAPLELALEAPFTAVLAPGEQTSLLLVVDGLSHQACPEVPIPFEAVVAAGHLRRDLSGALVQDQAYSELLAALQEGCLSLALHVIRQPESPSLAFLKPAAACLRRAARLGEAAEILLRVDPDQLGTVLHRLGRLGETRLTRPEDELVVQLEQGTAPSWAGLQLLARRHPEIARLWVNELEERGWPQEAREQARRASLLETDSASAVLALLDLREGRLVEARESAARHLQERLVSYGEDHPEVAAAWNLVASVMAAQGESAAACALVERGLASLEGVLGAQPDVAATLELLGDLREQAGADPRAAWERALELRVRPLDQAFLLERLARRGSPVRRKARVKRALDLLRSCRADGWRRGPPVSYQGWFASSSPRLIRPLVRLEPEAPMLLRLLEQRAALASGASRRRWQQQIRELQEVVVTPIQTGFAIRDCPGVLWIELASTDGRVWRTDDPDRALVRFDSGAWTELWPRERAPGLRHRLTLGLAGGFSWTSPEIMALR